MKPVDQLFRVDRDGHGDCVRACVASILELPADRVPHFGLFGWNWMHALASFCSVALVVPYEAEGFWIATGISPRGIGHACVYSGHSLAHDPHPSRGGLVGPVDGGLVLGDVHEHIRNYWRELADKREKESPDGR